MATASAPPPIAERFGRSMKRLVLRARTPKRARSLGTLSLGLMGFVVIGAAALTVFLVWRGLIAGDAAQILVGVGAALLGAALASALGALGDLYGQHARDLGAQAIFQALERGDDAPAFALYLRPFASTDAVSTTLLTLPKAAFAALPSAAMANTERFELESQIARAAAARIGPLVALGAPLEHIGAGRILVGDDVWQEAVKLLMAHAALIVLLPSARPGTLWEIDTLMMTGQSERIVVFDPPNAPVAAQADYDHGAEWERVRRAFGDHGRRLPEDDPSGMLVYFGGHAWPIAAKRFALEDDIGVGGFFDVVAARLGRVGRDLLSAQADGKRGESA